MALVTVIAGAAVIVVGAALALSAGRKHRKERHEIERFFSSDPDEHAWWDEHR